MMFYEMSFLLPFFLVYVLYIKLGKEKQNLLIILSSYYFYGLWDWRFLSLLIIQTLSDYMCAIFIDNTSDRKKQKFIMCFSIIFNLTMLGFFKYFNFFVDSFYTLFPNITPSSKIILNIILPPAISFYTFESMSYVIDVYRGTVKAERNFVSFGAFISFFPKLVAGPIERAHTLLNQINKDRTFSVDNFFSGLRLFAWGLFKKIVVADNLGALAEPVFHNPSAYTPFVLLVAAYCFSLQIYGDFSGYTDMARGLSRMMGIELSLNFNFPYFATSVSDFWRRWHITLGTWLRDYLYIPLGGSRTTKLKHIRNLMITFFASGLWHGASWTFVTWGILHGAFISMEALISGLKLESLISKIPNFIKIFLTFNVITCLWILFRCDSFEKVILYFSHLSNIINIQYLYEMLKDLVYSKTVVDLMLKLPTFYAPESQRYLFLFMIYSSTLLILQYVQYIKEDKEFDTKVLNVIRIPLYGLLISQIIFLGAQDAVQFIYFQF